MYVSFNLILSVGCVRNFDVLCEIRGSHTVFKFKVFLDMSPCRMVNIYRGFGEASFLCAQGVQINSGLYLCYYVQAFFEQDGEL